MSQSKVRVEYAYSPKLKLTNADFEKIIAHRLCRFTDTQFQYCKGIGSIILQIVT